tara:strand:- start:576 stop:1094 length:519 start_codon:yes stop_codon:yes gene_type:complete
MTQINSVERRAIRQKLKSYSDGNVPVVGDSLYWHYVMPVTEAHNVCDIKNPFDIDWNDLHTMKVEMLGLSCIQEPPQEIKNAVETWVQQPVPKFLYLSSDPDLTNVWHNVTDWIIRLIGLSYMSYIEVRGKSNSLNDTDKEIVQKISNVILDNRERLRMATFIHKGKSFFNF